MPLVRDVFEYMKQYGTSLPDPVDLPMEFTYDPKPMMMYKTLFKRTYSGIFFCVKVLRLYYEQSPQTINIIPTTVHDISAVIASTHPLSSLNYNRAKISRGSKDKNLLWYLPDLIVAYNKRSSPPMFATNNFILQYLSVVIFIIREIHEYNEGIEWADHGLNTAVIERSIGIESAKSMTKDLIESSPLFKEKPHLILKEFFGRDLGEHGDLLLESAIDKGTASNLLKKDR